MRYQNIRKITRRLKGPSQPPPFSMPSKLLILHGATKSYCFTVSCTRVSIILIIFSSLRVISFVLTRSEYNIIAKLSHVNKNKRVADREGPLNKCHYTNHRWFSCRLIHTLIYMFGRITTVNQLYSCMKRLFLSVEIGGVKGVFSNYFPCSSVEFEFSFSSIAFHLSIVSTQSHPLHMPYTFCNTILSYVDAHPYLGVTLDSKLRWNQHIHIITSKAMQILGLIKRNFWFCNEEVKCH